MKKIFYLLLFCCLTAITSLSAQDLFFNEIEYSNDDSSTSPDGVGIFGPVGTDLTGYEIQVYDNSGTVIQVIPLTGTIQADLPVTERGEIWVDIPILNVSNGAQGVVLVNPSGIAEQFVSFGPVNQTISAVIDGTPIVSQYIGSHGTGKSLQVVGTGCNYVDYSAGAGNAYINTQDPSHGELNESQVVDCPVDSGILPLELVSFNGELLNEKEVRLRWITASETSNYLTELQHSTDGRNFVTVHKEYGTGDKTTKSNYEFTDRLFAVGENYYRLLQTDLDGTVRYPGGIINIDTFNGVEILTIYPNPATDYIQVDFATLQTEGTQIKIYNLLGQSVYSALINAESRSQRVDTSRLEKGTYVIRIANLSAIIQKR